MRRKSRPSKVKSIQRSTIVIGTTNPRDAAPGTIRGDLAVELTENLVHGSDGPESAQREIALFFPNLG